MGQTGYGLRKYVALCVAMLLFAQGYPLALAQQRPAMSGQQSTGAPPQAQSPSPGRLSDSAVTSDASAQPDLDKPAAVASQSGKEEQRPPASQPGSEQRRDDTIIPVGTAAAPYETTIGAPASSPAGAAIAPAKQRRTRSILIKVGLIVGAGVAVGTVAALSSASSSKPH